MNKILKKQELAQKRHWRLRKKVTGTVERPRLNVKFTNLHIYAQAIDDTVGRTLVASATTEKVIRDLKLKANTTGAQSFGKIVGEKIKAAGINSIVFDRGDRQYHGTVKAFADAVREAGVQF
ncbi:MAG: 50S ribosomal protein L18 [Puniceicoccales bacterium]|jgi:large subunit ribosomal protein L18|nr:50S ribosomal protein L18 [Puniceicoccales bacterium]